MRIERGQVLVLAVLAGLVVTFFVGLWLPRQHRIAQLEQRIAAREIELAGLRADREEATKPTAKFSERTTAELGRALPVRPELGPLLERLSGDLASAGLTVRELQARTPVEGRTFDRIPITLQCTGPYTAIYELMRRIEGYERVVRVDRVVVTGGGPDPEAPLLADIELSTFRRTPEEVQP